MFSLSKNSFEIGFLHVFNPNPLKIAWQKLVDLEKETSRRGDGLHRYCVQCGCRAHKFLRVFCSLKISVHYAWQRKLDRAVVRNGLPKGLPSCPKSKTCGKALNSWPTKGPNTILSKLQKRPLGFQKYDINYWQKLMIFF